MWGLKLKANLGKFHLLGCSGTVDGKKAKQVKGNENGGTYTKIKVIITLTERIINLIRMGVSCLN